MAIHHCRLGAAAQDDEEGFNGESAATLQSGDEVVVVLGQKEQQAYLVGIVVGDTLEVTIRPMGAAGDKKTERAKKGDAAKVVVSGLNWICETPLAVLTMHAEAGVSTGDSKAAEGKSRGKGSRASGRASAEPLEEEHTVQYAGLFDEWYRLRHKGSEQSVIIRSLREHELSSHMLPPETIDVTRYLLCPMPGTLISCSVKPGQEVESGQELAVVEAMKMQNVLRAEKSGVVKDVRCAVGSHLRVDQIILEFESPVAGKK